MKNSKIKSRSWNLIIAASLIAPALAGADPICSKTRVLMAFPITSDATQFLVCKRGDAASCKTFIAGKLGTAFDNVELGERVGKLDKSLMTQSVGWGTLVGIPGVVLGAIVATLADAPMAGVAAVGAASTAGLVYYFSDYRAQRNALNKMIDATSSEKCALELDESELSALMADISAAAQAVPSYAISNAAPAKTGSDAIVVPARVVASAGSAR